jgi:hypothetical protein
MQHQTVQSAQNPMPAARRNAHRVGPETHRDRTFAALMHAGDLRSESKAAFREVITVLRGRGRQLRDTFGLSVNDRAERLRRFLRQLKDTAGALRIR